MSGWLWYVGAMWIDSGNILKVDPTGFLDGLDVVYEKNYFGPHTWKDGVALN